MSALVSVLLVEGDDLSAIGRRLEDIALRLQESDRTVPVSIIGGSYIVTVRPEQDAPTVRWEP